MELVCLSTFVYFLIYIFYFVFRMFINEIDYSVMK
jgi:hypothetical protein